MPETIHPPETVAPDVSVDTSRKRSNVLPVAPSKVYSKKWERSQLDENTLRDIAELFETPEAALALVILRETVNDLRADDFLKYSNALAFVRSARFTKIVAALDLDVSYVRTRCEQIAAARDVRSIPGALQFCAG